MMRFVLTLGITLLVAVIFAEGTTNSHSTSENSHNDRRIWQGRSAKVKQAVARTWKVNSPTQTLILILCPSDRRI